MASRRTARAAAVTAAGLAATALTGVAVSGPSAQAAVDATPGYSLRHITVDTKVGPANDVPCLVDADLYVPDGATSANRKPAILSTNGFGGSKDDSNESAIGRGFVKQGYIVLTYTGLGFPDSGCKVRLDDPQYDGKAGKQMVDVLAGTRSFHEGSTTRKLQAVSQESAGDPRVGMIGGSYGGQIQYAVAQQDPRVDALVPIITWNDLSYSLAPNNTSFSRGVTYTTPGVAKREWVDLFSTVGFTAGVQGTQVDPTRNLPPCPNFADEACAGVVGLNTVGAPSAQTIALARHASVATYMSKIKAPTLLVQGQRDTLFNLQESVATYRALRAQGTPTRMIWQSWGHSDSTPEPGELDFDAASLRDSFLGNRFLNWMNHYVKGDSAASVGPQFTYFRDWVAYDKRPGYAGKAIANAYSSHDSFSDAPTASLYFSGSDALVKAKSAVQTGSKAYANTTGDATSYSETSGLEGDTVNNPPSDTEGTFAAFTTPALRSPVNLLGSSQLTVHLDAPVAAAAQGADAASKLVLFAKIYDVAPDGTKTLHNRLISPVRVTDVTKPVTIALPGVVQRFAAGHKISVVLAASDLAYRGNNVVQPVTVKTSAAAPSVIRMPLYGELSFQ
jgi:predicted acyl esterase